MMKKTVSVLLCLALVAVMFTGCIPDSREFTCQDLTMDVPFLMKDVSSNSEFSDFTFTLDGNKVAIFGQREEFSEFEVFEITAMEYAQALIDANNHDCQAVTRSNGQYVYYSYEATVDGELFKYVAGCFKGTKAFWLVQFGGPAANFELETYLGYLDTVAVS